MKISVIVPVYNVENYLENCLNSLVNQTVKDIEIIAINDGSTDKSGEILNRYQKEFSNIKVIHQGNDGISAVRNKGIELSTGEYIAFIDSDDSVSLNFCEEMLNKALECDADITVCDYYEVCNEVKTEIKLPDFNKCTVFENPSLLFDINSSPWNKLYKKDFLIKHKAQFPVGLKYEDAAFVQYLFSKGASLSKVNMPLVFYTVRPKSETTVVKRNVFDSLKILDLIKGYYKSSDSVKYEKIELYLEYFAANRITIYNLQQVNQQEKSVVNEFIDSSFEYMKNNFPSWRANKHFNNANSLPKKIVKKNKLITKLVVWILRSFS